MANRRGKMKTVTDFIFLGSKITVDGDYNHEIKRCLLLGRKAMTNLDSMLKSRDNTLLTRIHIVKADVFPVVMYRCESWTIKKTEHWRIDVFEFLVVLEKTLGSPLDSKKIKLVNPKGNQPWIFIERTDAEAEAPILWLSDAENWLAGKDPDTGKDWKQKDMGQQRIRYLDSITDSMDMNLSKLWETVEDRGAWQAVVHEVTKSQTWLSDWTITPPNICCISYYHSFHKFCF